jgi:hypothetical protein
MELQGIANSAKSIDEDALFITITENASIPIDYGLIDGVSIASAPDLHAHGSVIAATVSDKLALYFNQAPVFQGGGGGGGTRRAAAWRRRAAMCCPGKTVPADAEP